MKMKDLVHQRLLGAHSVGISGSVGFDLPGLLSKGKIAHLVPVHFLDQMKREVWRKSCIVQRTTKCRSSRLSHYPCYVLVLREVMERVLFWH